MDREKIIIFVLKLKFLLKTAAAAVVLNANQLKHCNLIAVENAYC
jgi:hypothetical protein